MICDRCNHSWEIHAKSAQGVFTTGKDGKMKVKGTSLTACTSTGCPCDIFFASTKTEKEMSSGGP